MPDNIKSRLLRMKQLTEYSHLSRAYLYQQIKEGSFPSGYNISPGIRVWELTEVDAWLDKCMGKA